MGRRVLLLLLLAFLAPGATITLRPALKTLGSLHLPTSPASRPAVAKNYSVLYFQQKVDHFGFNTVKTFKQRYLIADEYWKKDGGSILFYTGNEGDIIWFCNNTGFMWDVAEELKAMLVFAEHRYYGESLPFGHSSYKDSRHLNFLTSEQALADFAELIKHLKRTIPGAENQPVIALGGSYGGMLSAWFRMKYPHIVVGALAASAPIWQFEDLVPCGVFMKIVTTDFRKSGPYCSDSIRRSWDAINRLSNTSRGIQWLTEAFHLCSPLASEKIQRLKDWITETWLNLAMVDYPYASNFLQPLPAWPIKVVCQYLRNPNVSDSLLLQNIFQALNVYYNYSGQAKCLNISETTTSNLGSLGWSYQACTEMVMPFCTNGIDDMFEPHLWNLKEFSDDCFNQWGVRPRPSWITTLYGGKNISSHTNIVFSNGELDPWSGGGVTKDITDTLVAITIPEGAHHLDLRASNALDPRSVLLARTLEVKHMKKWIRDFYNSAGKQK
ncbi:lysosomal Pro-X carboxypeptidase [Lemur catta]|uniref:lysosomal Pro-X carboxypeptidase n=1 Tax=Lemur catta TaxID=9447 RepID=UPI001E26E052|nr:lysosomal Pro-X carboxypeptidase [Lemur catta]XP_045413207.1 lysosomal Pro-X carboxypeptidase [Lemur catta]XP_045413208.1 lysosomal Pro-X carboxypeptidase [Lemur catta]